MDVNRDASQWPRLRPLPPPTSAAGTPQGSAGAHTAVASKVRWKAPSGKATPPAIAAAQHTTTSPVAGEGVGASHTDADIHAPQPPGRPARRRTPRVDPTLHENRAAALPGWVALMMLLAGTATMVAILGATGRIPYWDALPDIRSPAVRAGSPGAPTAGMLTVFVVAGLLVLLSVTGLLVNSSGQARVLTRWGRYRGTVRRTGLLWVNPLLRRRRVDVGLRHWRSENVHVVDRTGLPIVVKLLLVWRVKDTARAHFTVADHEGYLREQVQAAVTRTASALPCDSNGVPGPALRDGDWFGDELTCWLAPQVTPVGLEVFSVQPLALDYAPEVAESMRRRQLADLEASLRTVVLDDAIETASLAVQRLEHTTAQELDSTARNALMEHLLVAFLAPTADVRTGAPFNTRTRSSPSITRPTKAATSSVPAPADRPENNEER